MNFKLLLCLALVLSDGLIGCSAVPDPSTDVTNVLRSLLTDKNLVLSSRPKFIIQTTKYNDSALIKNFAHIDILAPKMIQQFGFKARLSRPGHPTTIMQVAANEDHTTVLVETSEGQPYCLMADHLLFICDPDHLGGLAYYEGGTVLWGLFQAMDRTNASFQMTFMPTNVPPATILDLSFVIKSAWAKKANASYEAGSKIIRIQTSTTSQEIELSNDPHDSFGIEEVKINGGNAAFDFSDFQIETTPMKGLFRVSKNDLQQLNLPLRALNTAELNHFQLLIPDGFPVTTVEKEAANKLQALIKDHLSQ